MNKQTKNIKDILRSLAEIEILRKKYKIGNKEIISVFDLKLLSIKGHEYIVFKYENKVIKIHRKYFVGIHNLDQQNILSLIGIPTKRILLPTDPIYDLEENNIEGYAMDLITDEKDISSETVNHLLEEMSIIYSDKNLLSEKGILLRDLHNGNAVYNDKINIIDSGRYINTNVYCPNYISDYLSLLLKSNNQVLLEEYIGENNTRQVNNFFYKYIMETVLYKVTNTEKIAYLSKISAYLKYLSKEMDTQNYLNIIESISNKEMTVEELAKKLIKTTKNMRK